jgi:hypothetical protein
LALIFEPARTCVIMDTMCSPTNNCATRESRDSQIVAIPAAAELAVLAYSAVVNAKKARHGRALFDNVSPM